MLLWMLLRLFCTLLRSSGDTGACRPLGPAPLSDDGLLGDDDGLGLLVAGVLVASVVGGVGLGPVGGAAGPLGVPAGVLAGVAGGAGAAGVLGTWYL